jgi:hypothetical protein
MTGAIDMGANKITSTYTPTNNPDLTTKVYVDAILGSATVAATSAANAATSETNAATSETNAGNSASAALASQNAAAASYDLFDDRFLGAKSSAPTLDNDGNALVVGTLYFNSTSNIMYVYSAAGWQAAGSSVNGTSDRQTYTASSGQTVFAAAYDAGYIDVFLNGVKLVAGTDFTATNGTSITLASGATINDVIDIVAYGTFVLADHYDSTASDARYVQQTHTGNVDITGTITADGLTSVFTSDTQGKFSGWSVVGANSSSGAIELGQSPAFQGIISYAADDNTRFIFDNSYGSTSSTFEFRSNTAATPKTHMKIAGNGDISFYEDTGTTAKFFWDASAEKLLIGETSNSTASGLYIKTADPTDLVTGQLVLKGTALTGAADTGASIVFEGFNGSGNRTLGSIQSLKENSTVGDSLAYMRFSTFGSSGTQERMRIDSSGRLLLGTTTEGNADADNLTISGSGNVGMTFRSTDSVQNSIFFSDSTSGIPEYAGFLQYNHASNFMNFGTNAIERMRIDSSGNVGIGTSSPAGSYGKNLQIHTAATSGSSLQLTDGTTGSGVNDGLQIICTNGLSYIWNREATGMVFATSNLERMRIDSSGNVGIGTSAPLGNLQIVTATAGTVLNVNHNTGGTYPKASGIGLGATSTALSVSSDGSTVLFTGGAGLYAENTAASGNPTNLVFWTNLAGTPAEAMRIDSSGVLMGTTVTGAV